MVPADVILQTMSSSANKTTAVRILFPLSRTRVVVKTLTLPGDVRQDGLPKGYVREDHYLLGTSRWKGISLRHLAFGLALATAQSKHA